LVHEEGHMLGLGHGGPYNGNVNAGTQQFSAFDSRLWTLMSYIDPFDTTAKYYASYPVTGTNWGVSPDGYYYEPTTPMILDILSAQRLYGVATSGPLASGGQTFGFHSNISGLAGQYFDFTVNTHPVITIWDGGINNTLDLSGFSANATISLVPGTFTSCNGEVNNIGIAEGTTIDHVLAGSGNDTITCNSSNDTVDPGAGNNKIIGGSGVNTLNYSTHSGAATINTLTGVAQNGMGGTDTFSGLQHFLLGPGSDTFSAMGDGSNYTVDPGNGNNTINGGSGVLTLDYSTHSGAQVVDVFNGVAQNGLGGVDHFNNIAQFLMGTGQDTVYGGPGNHLFVGGSGNDNTISYIYSTNPVTIDLALGSVQNGWGGVDHMGSFEYFIGGQGNDTLLGGPGQVFLDGAGGWNIVDYSRDPGPATFDMLHGFYRNGYGGMDHLGNFEVFKGTPYNDLFVPPPGSTYMDGGAGTNTLDYSQQPGAIIADLSAGTVQNGFGGTDHISNFQMVIAGASNDTLIGGPGSSTFYGGGGNNTFVFKDGFGPTTIADFTNSAGNVLDLSGVSAFHTLTDVQSHMSQAGSDVVIADPAGGSVTIQNTTTAYLLAHQNELIA
jgi:Ca2+-binding RTX toxin-like protein